MDNVYSNIYIEYESNRVRNETLSIKKWLDKIRLYLKEGYHK